MPKHAFKVKYTLLTKRNEK